MTSEDLLLLPRPKKITVREGALKRPSKGCVVLQGEDRGRLFVGAEKLVEALAGDWKITASRADRPRMRS